MAGEFGCPGADSFEDRDKRSRGDQTRVGRPGLVLPIEVAAVLESRSKVSHRNAKYPTQIEKNGSEGFVAMDVLMRVEVTRLAIHESLEGAVLFLHLVADGLLVVVRDDPIERFPFTITVSPFAKIHMQTHAEARMPPGVFRSRGSGRPSNHQAGTCHDAIFMSGDDPAVRLVTQPKIVGIDDE
jgi:hypothetical protein